MMGDGRNNNKNNQNNNNVFNISCPTFTEMLVQGTDCYELGIQLHRIRPKQIGFQICSNQNVNNIINNNNTE